MHIVIISSSSVLEGGGEVPVLSCIWQIMTFEIFTEKNKTWKFCLYNNTNLLLFINNTNVFKQVVCVRTFL